MEPERNLWEQNIALWEKWTSSYTDTMFKAMEKTLEQSSTFRGQVDRAVNSAMSTQLEMGAPETSRSRTSSTAARLRVITKSNGGIR